MKTETFAVQQYVKLKHVRENICASSQGQAPQKIDILFRIKHINTLDSVTNQNTDFS